MTKLAPITAASSPSAVDCHGGRVHGRPGCGPHRELSQGPGVPATGRVVSVELCGRTGALWSIILFHLVDLVLNHPRSYLSEK